MRYCLCTEQVQPQVFAVVHNISYKHMKDTTMWKEELFLKLSVQLQHSASHFFRRIGLDFNIHRNIMWVLIINICKGHI